MEICWILGVTWLPWLGPGVWLNQQGMELLVCQLDQVIIIKLKCVTKTKNNSIEAAAYCYHLLRKYKANKSAYQILWSLCPLKMTFFEQ